MKRLTLLTFSFFLAISCGKNTDYVHHDNPPPIRVSRKSYPVLRVDNKVDVLWIIDNSGSMGGIQKNIVDNSKLFMQDFIKDKFIDWRMSVLSTDKKDSFYLGLNPLFDRHYVDPDPSQDLVSVFSSAVKRLGVGGDWSEYVFYNTHRALNETSMKDFFRSDAHLAVIMVTDEAEQSQRFGAQFKPVQFLKDIKKNMVSSKILRFYGAFNFKDLKGCSRYQPLYAGSPFEKVITDTGGIVLSACDKKFGVGLAEVGKDIVSFAKSPYIALNERPDTKTLVVSFDGKVIKGGPRHLGGHWYYDEYFNKIYFYNLDFMPEGTDADIEVSFDIYDGRDRG